MDDVCTIVRHASRRADEQIPIDCRSRQWVVSPSRARFLSPLPTGYMNQHGRLRGALRALTEFKWSSRQGSSTNSSKVIPNAKSCLPTLLAPSGRLAGERTDKRSERRATPEDRAEFSGQDTCTRPS